jgi:hypothetical protein
LNTDFRINNERQDHKTGTVWGEGVNGGHEDEAIGLMGFIYIKETE